MRSSTRIGSVSRLIPAALAVSFAALPSVAHAYTVHTDRASWEAAVAAAPACQAHQIYTDTFSANIPQAQTITFPSRVRATNSDLLGGLQVSVTGAITGDPSNSVQNGYYINSLDIRSAPDKVNSSEVRWALPPHTCAFALDTYSVDLVSAFSRKLGVAGAFDGPGPGEQFINLTIAAPPTSATSSAFVGVVGTAEFPEIIFRVALDYSPSANNTTFSVDSALYASRYSDPAVVPTLGGRGLALFAGLMAIAAAVALRRGALAG